MKKTRKTAVTAAVFAVSMGLAGCTPESPSGSVAEPTTAVTTTEATTATTEATTTTATETTTEEITTAAETTETLAEEYFTQEYNPAREDKVMVYGPPSAFKIK